MRTKSLYLYRTSLVLLVGALLMGSFLCMALRHTTQDLQRVNQELRAENEQLRLGPERWELGWCKQENASLKDGYSRQLLILEGFLDRDRRANKRVEMLENARKADQARIADLKAENARLRAAIDKLIPTCNMTIENDEK